MLDDAGREHQVGTRVWVLVFLFTGCVIFIETPATLSFSFFKWRQHFSCLYYGYPEDPDRASQTPQHFGMERTIT